MRKFKIYYLFVGLLLFLASVSLYFISANRREPRTGYDKPEGFVEYFRGITIPFGQKVSGYKPNYALSEYRKAQENAKLQFKNAKALNWIHRGPGNVGGRTRTILIDPDDKTGNTWFAGSASGGIWKTTNAGKTWANLTPELPNLSTATLSIAPSNTQVIYAGTGEGYGGEGMVSGSGLFVTRNKGLSWHHIASTAEDKRFRYINKIWVSPSNDSVLLVATNKGIFKTFNAGESWTAVYNLGYAIQDLVQNPLNPSVIYAGANSLGVLRSNNEGNTWHIASEGIAECQRVALSVSPADTACVFAGVESPNQKTQIYYSSNSGSSWQLNYNSDGLFINFHQLQGWFNNTVAAHPFEKNKVFIGGVYFGMLEFLKTTYTGEPQLLRADTLGTGSFLSFVNFGGSHLNGGLTTGLAEDAEVEVEDFVSVEIRFGAGRHQKAHRFLVPEGQGSGVPASYYEYQDYVSVPFEVWDIENNRQLMVSFRDQDRNGAFNLTERVFGNDISGREYIFVSAYTYSEATPQTEIMVNGGHEQKLLYFLWPSLKTDAAWTPQSLPESTIRIKFGTITYQAANTSVLADDRLNENLHVDHHDIKFHITDSLAKQFKIIEANDGGIGFSANMGKSWEQINKGYLTTQFYGMAKRPGAFEYIGGMQDNGTWQSPVNSIAQDTSEYKRRIEGDGFEVLWHPWYPQRILGSSYNNYIKVSNDYGETWQWTFDGINGDGPFITKLSNAVSNPNLVFAVGSKGLYKHRNFGIGSLDWESIPMGDGWAIENTVTSMHHVEVSQANDSVIFAGGGMYKNPDLNLFVSKDFGKTFDTLTNFTGREMGYISGLATHPTNPAEAFVLFSFDSKPKVIRSMDFGKTWEELSGFGADSSSSNGFPDVVVNDLLVLPHDTNTIWVGTEIGLFESTDNGKSWHYANNGLPPVSIWQMNIIDGEILVATHGRGLWTTSYEYTLQVPEKTELSINSYPNPANELVNISLNSQSTGEVDLRIYNLSGKLVYNKVFMKSAGEYAMPVEINQLTEGLYIISVKHEGKQNTQKLVIRR